MITGCGPSPSGRTRKPWTRCPCGFENHQESNGRPAGARGPSGSSSGTAEPTASSRAGCSPLWPRYQTVPSGRTPAAVIEPCSVASARHGGVREAVPVQGVAPGLEDQQEQRGAVRPPVHGLHGPGQVQLELRQLARARVPQRGPPVAGPLVRDRHAQVARHRREPEPGELQALVPQPGERLAGHGVQGAQGRVEDVAVLHDLEHHDRVVGGQRRSVHGPSQARARGEADRLRVAMEEPDVPAVIGDPDGELVVRADRSDGPPSPDRQPLRPTLRQPAEQRLRGQVLVERRDDVRAGLVAGLVAEPDHAAAVAGRAPLEHADRVEGDLASPARPPVPRVELVRAALGGRDHQAVGVLVGPGGEGQDGRSEALLPVGMVGHAPRVSKPTWIGDVRLATVQPGKDFPCSASAPQYPVARRAQASRPTSGRPSRSANGTQAARSVEPSNSVSSSPPVISPR